MNLAEMKARSAPADVDLVFGPPEDEDPITTDEVASLIKKSVETGFLIDAIRLIEETHGLIDRITDPHHQRYINHENWVKLLKIEMQMDKFLRKLKV